MARTIAAVQNQILAYAQTNYGVNVGDPFYYIFHDKNNVAITPSRTNKFVLISYIVAVAIALFEQILDVFRSDVEYQVSLEPPGTPRWLQNQVFLFQYDATVPQVVQLNTSTYRISYPVVNPDLRIITQCAIITNPNKIVIVKVASNSTAITTPQKNALISYLDYLNFAGVYFSVVSADADLLMLGIDVYYDGQYSGSIAIDVTNAINDHLATSGINNFDGKFFLSKMEDIIQAVPGVTDVVLRQVEVRPASVLPASAIKMVDDYDELLRNYSPYAGYLAIDSSGGRDLASTLTFIVT